VFSILGESAKLCDGLSRREMLRVGGVGTLGLSLADLLRASTVAAPTSNGDPTFGRAKNLIFVWLQGGPPQHETFDPKPRAPIEIRGPLKPIQTNIPGIQFCELLPRTARMADKLATIRSMATDSNIHSASAYEVLTGVKYRGPNPRTITPDDWPYFGSILKMLRPSEQLPPLSTVWIPQIMRLNENVTPAGQTAGFLGRQWDPDRFTGNPADPNYKVDGLQLTGISPLRIQRRMTLLEQVDKHFAERGRGKPVQVYDQFQQQALDLVTSGKVRDAFAVQQEPKAVRDRYGRTKWGQCMLLARRLIEVGARMVHVNWTREAGDSAVSNPLWDTHAQNADRLEDVLCPVFDIGFTALMEDLDRRGMLEETLVVAIGEFGRTPRINRDGGRDHWGAVFSFLMAGAGIQGGQVVGASDSSGGYPARDRVTPADLLATIFHLLGLSHEGAFRDAQNRELRLTTGRPIGQVLGSGFATELRTKPGGDIARVPPYNEALLLNTNFEDPVPLRPTNLGSRPKGWRATPQTESLASNAFGVRLVGTAGSHEPGEQRGVAIGVDVRDNSKSLTVTAGASALLAQELRNLRAGSFLFTVKACGQSVSREVYESLFLKNFAARMILFRYVDQAKDPTMRNELASLEIQSEFCELNEPRFQTFELAARFDSPGPGQNFSIGNGIGVAILVERTDPGELQLSADGDGQFAFLRIDEAKLEFAGRTIDDNVIV